MLKPDIFYKYNFNTSYIEIGKQCDYNSNESIRRRVLTWNRARVTMLACTPYVCVFANQRVAKGNDRKSRRRNCFLSGRKFCRSPLHALAPIPEDSRVLFPKQSGTIRGAESAKDETRRDETSGPSEAVTRERRRRQCSRAKLLEILNTNGKLS